MDPSSRPNPTRRRLERRLSQRFFPRRVLTAQIEPANCEFKMVAVVQNLSGRGICLVCPQNCEPGSELRLRMLNAAATSDLDVTLRVVRCEPELAGGHFMGCEFTRTMEPEELRPFLV
jgi:hypothetical protein